MIRRTRPLRPAALAPLAAVLLAGALGAAPAAPRLRIVASILPLRDFAAAVAGDRGDVSLLLPPGADVHSWQPRPGDLIRLSRADLFLFVGAGLEPWLDDVLGGIRPSRVRTLEASRGLPLIEAAGREPGGKEPAGHRHGAEDPHLWLDFGLDAKMADAIEAALAALDPQGADAFRANAAALKARLDDLDRRFRDGLAACAGRTVIVGGHAAFAYLCRRYGLTQWALSGTSPDAEPSPRRVIEAVERMRRDGIRAVFREPAASPALARTLAREVGGRVLTLQTGLAPGPGPAAPGLFFTLMDRNLETLRDGLGCR